MKINLIIIAMLLSLTGMGQTYWSADTIVAKHLQRSDTIEILMLVSDTSQFEYDRETKRINEKVLKAMQDTTQMLYINTPLRFSYTSQIAFHMKGYFVRNRWDGRFLGSDKKPISKTLVVWDYFKIRKP